MIFTEYFNWNCFIWPFAVYGAYSFTKNVLGLSLLSFFGRLLHMLFWNRDSTIIGELRSLLDDRRIITENRMIITIICDNRSPTGHAFLLFEMKHRDYKSTVFYRADYGPERITSDSESMSQISSGRVKIVVQPTHEIDVVLQWLNCNGEYQSFPYRYENEAETVEQITALEEKSDEFTYSLSGDHSSVSVNSRENNHNCATWCAHVMKESFDINIGLDDKFWMPIRTPAYVVNSAKNNSSLQYLLHKLYDFIL